MSLRHAFASILCGAVLVACGGSQSEPQAAAAQPTAEPAPSSPPEAAAVQPAAPPQQPAAVQVPASWAEADGHEQQAAFMKAHVVPEMGELFRAFDGEKYAQFGCPTCHGRPFQDPPEHLPKLTFQGGKMTAFAEHPAIAKFMSEQVLPKMIGILGVQPYDPKTNQGFGCNGCHTVEAK